jgi:hypothetical protein
MARRNDDEHSAPRRRSPAKTPEERESILISKSLNLIERQIDDGSVSSTVLSIYAKAGTERDRLEKEKMGEEIVVLKKKVETMQSAVDMKNLMEDAVNAFKGYSGQRLDDDDDDDEDDYYD